MQENQTYYDDVLIKLKRTYGKDEAVAALSKKISELEIELGKSTAYIQELEHEKTLEGKELRKQIRLDEAYKMRSNENKNLRKNLQKVQKINRGLVHQICLLKNQKP